MNVKRIASLKWMNKQTLNTTLNNDTKEISLHIDAVFVAQCNNETKSSEGCLSEIDFDNQKLDMKFRKFYYLDLEHQQFGMIFRRLYYQYYVKRMQGLCSMYAL